MTDTKQAHRSRGFDELANQVLAESGIEPASMIRYFARIDELRDWVDGGVRKRSALQKNWQARYAEHTKRTRATERARREKID